MNNEDILKENNGKKFDICLMNPPYGSAGGETLHLKFVDKILDIANKQITIMPFNFVKKENRSYEKFKDKFSSYLTEIEEVDKDIFVGVTITNGNTAIYSFNDNKKSNEINIISKDNNYTIKNVKEISSKKFYDYEKNIINYLESKGQQPGCHAGGTWKRRQDIEGMTTDEIKKWEENSVIKNSKELKKYIENNPKEHYILTVNSHGAYPYAKFLSAKAGEIFNSYKEIEDYFIELKKPSGFIVLIFDSYEGAKNCKEALLRPLLRLTLYRLQEDHNLFYTKHYKYIPNIDWSDDKTKTDEGILELCGCPKDKVKEYAEYCKKIIDEVDKK